MSARMRRVLQLTALALVLIVAANIVLLRGVAENRAGEPEAELFLSGREFYPWLGQQSENSGRFLRLRYQEVRNEGADDTWTSNSWLDREKLASLGYRLPPEGAGEEGSGLVHKYPQKNVFVVLELQGQAYEQNLVQAAAEVDALRLALKSEALQDAEERLRRARDEDSRLFLVDAGLDAQALRQRYPRRDQYVILPGQVRLWLQRGYRQGATRWDSRVSLESEQVFVPLEFAQEFASILQQTQAKGGSTPLQFQVRLAFGQRLEPWIRELRAGQGRP